VTAELNIHIENPVSTKTVRRELHKSNIHGRAAIAKPLITESNAQMCKRWCHDQKTKTIRQLETRVRWSDESSFTLFRTSGRVYLRLQNSQSGILGTNSETRGKFCGGLGSNIMVFVWSHYYPSWPNYCKGYVERLGNQVHPMIQTLFPNNDAVFQDMAPIHTAGAVQSWFKEHDGGLQYFPDQHNHQI
jgi:hypothetical protein